MANYKTLRFTVPHGVVEAPLGTFTPATISVEARNADDSLETLVLTVIAVDSIKDVTLDLGAEPCCTNIISGPYIVCPDVDNSPAVCAPLGDVPVLVDPVLIVV